MTSNTSSPRSRSFDSGMEKRGRSQSTNGRSSSANSDIQVSRSRSKSLLEQMTDGNDTSDWSSTGSLISGREKASPTRDISPIHHGRDTSDILHKTISERVVEHLPSSSESDLEIRKESKSQRIIEKETDTLSEFSSSSLLQERPPLQQQDKVELKVNGSTSENLDSGWKDQHHHNQKLSADTITRSRPRRIVEEDRPSRGIMSPSRKSPSPSSRSTPSPPRILLSDGTDYKISLNQSTVRSSTSHASHRSSPSIESRGNGGASIRHSDDETRVDRIERVDRKAEEQVRIKIKRPKDYILQWEETIDRLSGVSVSDDPSPRPPLISNYRVDMSTRSKSLENNNPIQRKYPERHSLRSRSSDISSRLDQQTTSSPVQPSNLQSSITSTLYTSSRSSTPTGQRGSSPCTMNDSGLETALEKLPEHLKQKASEASKFLMHSTGPEIINLLDAIRQAHDSSQTAVPKSEAVRPPRLESSPAGSRVRFQTSPRSISHDSSFVPSRVYSSPLGRQQTHFESVGQQHSLSPRNRSRSRSLSPRNTTSQGFAEDATRSPVRREHHDSESGNRSYREEVLLKNLGFNSRVIEDERPSNRLKMIASSSPRSSAAITHSSPRKTPIIQRTYPEVTRLDLGLDSDRSYMSHSQTDDIADDISPRRGGHGRVPRREAWEQQRRKRDEISAMQDDPVAQSKFIDVLVNEINLLKHKVEMIEVDNVERQEELSRNASVSSNTRTGSSYLRSELVDDDNELILAPRISQPINCPAKRASSCPLLETSSRSLHLNRSVSRENSSAKHPSTYISPRRSVNMPASKNIRRERNLSASSDTKLQPLVSGISFGYNGPARSITPEIWGYDLTASNGVDPSRQESWKRLISSRDLTEAEVIELKQALACAIVENDILQAKLNNAKHEIHDKLRHTNEVLEDCRHHLAKSQAENMVLRSKVEQERQRADGYEERIKTMEKDVFEV